jgi:diguanylate cyclase (GGDEF)-like protein
MMAFRNLILLTSVLVMTSFGSAWATGSCDPARLSIATQELSEILRSPWKHLWHFRRIPALFKEIREGIKDLKTQKRTDELTQINNRQAYAEDLPELIREQQRLKNNFALIVVDLDFFKSVNDTFGHVAGDAALKHTAQTIKAMLRAGDQVYRVGGEEFVIFMKDANIKGIENTLHRIARMLNMTSLQHDIDESWVVRQDDMGPLHLSFSAGATFVEVDLFSQSPAIQAYIQRSGWHPPKDADPLFARADDQLYQVKHRMGRGKLSITEQGFPFNQSHTTKLFNKVY